jgi:hypothetical protein
VPFACRVRKYPELGYTPLEAQIQAAKNLHAATLSLMGAPGPVDLPVFTVDHRAEIAGKAPSLLADHDVQRHTSYVQRSPILSKHYRDLLTACPQNEIRTYGSPGVLTSFPCLPEDCLLFPKCTPAVPMLGSASPSGTRVDCHDVLAETFVRLTIRACATVHLCFPDDLCLQSCALRWVLCLSKLKARVHPFLGWLETRAAKGWSLQGEILPEWYIWALGWMEAVCLETLTYMLCSPARPLAKSSLTSPELTASL